MSKELKQRRCWGITDHLTRCDQPASPFLYCKEHRKQPFVWVFTLVFTVITGILTFYPYFISEKPKLRDLDFHLERFRDGELEEAKDYQLAVDGIVQPIPGDIPPLFPEDKFYVWSKLDSKYYAAAILINSKGEPFILEDESELKRKRNEFATAPFDAVSKFPMVRSIEPDKDEKSGQNAIVLLVSHKPFQMERINKLLSKIVPPSNGVRAAPSPPTPTRVHSWSEFEETIRKKMENDADVLYVLPIENRVPETNEQ